MILSDLYQKLVLLSPLLTIVISIVMMMSIPCILHKSHSICITSTVIAMFGIISSLLSTLIICDKVPIKVNLLMFLDNFSILCIILMLISNLVIVILAYHWLVNNIQKYNEFYILLLITLTGSILIIYTDHFIALFLGIELLSVPLFGMVGYNYKCKMSLEASIKYTILSMIASSILLFGISLIYTSIGKLSLHEINQIFIINKLVNPVLIIGFSMVIVGLGFKMSLVPFHLWIPDIYHVTPTPVIITLTITNKLSLFILMMKLYLSFPINNNDILKTVLIIISIFSMLFGNLMALNQNNIKRILGYSSISHTGYLLTILITSNNNHQTILEITGTYLISYTLTNLGTLSTISLISDYLYIKNENYVDSIYFYRGLFKHNKLLSLSLTISILSLAGIPMTVGFISKFCIILVGLDSNLSWIIGIFIISSLIGLLYCLKLIINLYLSPNTKILNYKCNNTTSYFKFNVCNLLVVILSVLIIGLGLYPQPIFFITKMFT